MPQPRRGDTGPPPAGARGTSASGYESLHAAVKRSRSPAVRRGAGAGAAAAAASSVEEARRLKVEHKYELTALHGMLEAAWLQRQKDDVERAGLKQTLRQQAAQQRDRVDKRQRQQRLRDNQKAFHTALRHEQERQEAKIRRLHETEMKKAMAALEDKWVASERERERSLSRSISPQRGRGRQAPQTPQAQQPQQCMPQRPAAGTRIHTRTASPVGRIASPSGHSWDISALSSIRAGSCASGTPRKGSGGNSVPTGADGHVHADERGTVPAAAGERDAPERPPVPDFTQQASLVAGITRGAGARGGGGSGAAATATAKADAGVQVNGYTDRRRRVEAIKQAQRQQQQQQADSTRPVSSAGTADRGTSKRTAGNPGERLYRDGEVMELIKRDWALGQREYLAVQRRKEATFRPKITAYADKIYATRRSARDGQSSRAWPRSLSAPGGTHGSLAANIVAEISADEEVCFGPGGGHAYSGDAHDPTEPQLPRAASAADTMATSAGCVDGGTMHPRRDGAAMTAAAAAGPRRRKSEKADPEHHNAFDVPGLVAFLNNAYPWTRQGAQRQRPHACPASRASVRSASSPSARSPSPVVPAGALALAQGEARHRADGRDGSGLVSIPLGDVSPLTLSTAGGGDYAPWAPPHGPHGVGDPSAPPPPQPCHPLQQREARGARPQPQRPWSRSDRRSGSRGGVVFDRLLAQGEAASTRKALARSAVGIATLPGGARAGGGGTAPAAQPASTAAAVGTLVHRSLTPPTSTAGGTASTAWCDGKSESFAVRTHRMYVQREASECTFQPNAARRRRSASAGAGDAHVRLYADAANLRDRKTLAQAAGELTRETQRRAGRSSAVRVGTAETDAWLHRLVYSKQSQEAVLAKVREALQPCTGVGALDREPRYTIASTLAMAMPAGTPTHEGGVGCGGADDAAAAEGGVDVDAPAAAEADAEGTPLRQGQDPEERGEAAGMHAPDADVGSRSPPPSIATAEPLLPEAARISPPRQRRTAAAAAAPPARTQRSVSQGGRAARAEAGQALKSAVAAAVPTSSTPRGTPRAAAGARADGPPLGGLGLIVREKAVVMNSRNPAKIASAHDQLHRDREYRDWVRRVNEQRPLIDADVRQHLGEASRQLAQDVKRREVRRLFDELRDGLSRGGPPTLPCTAFRRLFVSEWLRDPQAGSDPGAVGPQQGSILRSPGHTPRALSPEKHVEFEGGAAPALPADDDAPASATGTPTSTPPSVAIDVVDGGVLVPDGDEDGDPRGPVNVEPDGAGGALDPPPALAAAAATPRARSRSLDSRSAYRGAVLPTWLRAWLDALTQVFAHRDTTCGDVCATIPTGVSDPEVTDEVLQRRRGRVLEFTTNVFRDHARTAAAASAIPLTAVRESAHSGDDFAAQLLPRLQETGAPMFTYPELCRLAEGSKYGPVRRTRRASPSPAAAPPPVPAVHARSRSSANLYRKLHDDASEKRKRVESMASAMQKVLPKECTFKPKINKAPPRHPLSVTDIATSASEGAAAGTKAEDGVDRGMLEACKVDILDRIRAMAPG